MLASVGNDRLRQWKSPILDIILIPEVELILATIQKSDNHILWGWLSLFVSLCIAIDFQSDNLEHAFVFNISRRLYYKADFRYTAKCFTLDFTERDCYIILSFGKGNCPSV